MINLIVGEPGSGKSALSAELMIKTLERNIGIWKKYGTFRPVYSNLYLTDEYMEQYKGFIQIWKDINSLAELRDCDIFIDEIAGYFNNRNWQDLKFETRAWLMMHEHYGIEVYGNTQNFQTVELSFRRLTSNLSHVRKLAGSPRPSPTKPVIKKIWGLMRIREVDRSKFDKEEFKFEYADIIGDFRFITKDLCSIFNTRQDLNFKEGFCQCPDVKICGSCHLPKH